MVFRRKQKSGPKRGFPRVFACFAEQSRQKKQLGAAPEHLKLLAKFGFWSRKLANLINFNGAERGGGVYFRNRREKKTGFPAMASANVPLFLYYGPGAAKSATKKICLARGFARGLPDEDPGRSHGVLSGMLSIPMVGLVSLGEGRWVSGSSMRRKAIPLRAPLMSDQEGNNTAARAPARLCSL